MNEQQPQPVFAIERIYLKDASVEVPNAPQVFLEQTSPAIDIQLRNEARVVDNGLYEVVLTATVTAKLQDRTVFLVEVAQGGIFRIGPLQQHELELVINVVCPTNLLPYAREAIAGLLGRASFPPVTLPHVSFEEIYQKRLQELQQQQQAAAAPAAGHA